MLDKWLVINLVKKKCSKEKASELSKQWMEVFARRKAGTALCGLI